MTLTDTLMKSLKVCLEHALWEEFGGHIDVDLGEVAWEPDPEPRYVAVRDKISRNSFLIMDTKHDRYGLTGLSESQADRIVAVLNEGG